MYVLKQVIMAELGWIIHKKIKLKLGLNLENFQKGRFLIRNEVSWEGSRVGTSKTLGRVFHVSKLILHMSRN